MNEDDPLMSLAELIDREQTYYATGEYPSKRSLHITRWATLGALQEAERQGWRFTRE